MREIDGVSYVYCNRCGGEFDINDVDKDCLCYDCVEKLENELNHEYVGRQAKCYNSTQLGRVYEGMGEIRRVYQTDTESIYCDFHFNCDNDNDDIYHRTIFIKDISIFSQAKDFKCNMCNGEMLYTIYNGTHIWVCKNCPNVQFEFVNDVDVDNLRKVLIENKD